MVQKYSCRQLNTQATKFRNNLLVKIFYLFVQINTSQNEQSFSNGVFQFLLKEIDDGEGGEVESCLENVQTVVNIASKFFRNMSENNFFYLFKAYTKIFRI